MSKLISKLDVPLSVRKSSSISCPSALNIFEDRVESEGKRKQTWFFRDYIGIDMAKASLHCAFSGVLFVTKENKCNRPTNGFGMLRDEERVNFCSGVFSYKDANDFVEIAYQEIKDAFDSYKNKGSNSDMSKSSLEDDLKKRPDSVVLGKQKTDSINGQKKNNALIYTIIIGIIIVIIAFASGSCEKSSNKTKWSDLSEEEKENARWAYYAKQAAEDYREKNK